MTTGAGGGLSAEINMTPLIDVLLVLLIIFMVITPLKPKGLESRVPQPSPAQTPPETVDRTVVVSLDKDAALRINEEPIALEKFQERLSGIFKLRAEKVCFVKADPDLEYRFVAQVIDMAKGAGVDELGLITAANVNAVN